MDAKQVTARAAGLLYLGVAVATGVGAAARSGLIVAGDAAATAEHIRASEGLFRLAIAADLASAALFLSTALALYALLRSVGPAAATAMVAFTTVATAVQALNLLTDMGALAIATGGPSSAVAQSADAGAFVQLLVGLQHDGFLLSQAFFALWLLPLGWLVVRSGWIPRVLGYLLMAACVGYLVDLSTFLLTPGLESAVLPASALVGAVAELGFAGWLLVVGAGSGAHGADARTAETLNVGSPA